MDGRTPNNHFGRNYPHAHYLPTSSIAYLPSSCDEELVEEADEPPDNFMHLFSQSYHSASVCEGEFSKHSIRNSAPTESLLTKALTSPALRPITTADDATPKTRLHRGMSTSSTWSSASAASTVDLTSDGLTSPSRANTPSPTPPMFFAGIPSILQGTKIAFAGPKLNTDFTKKEVVPARKPGITFACMGQQAPAAEQQQTQPPVQHGDNAPPKKKAGLTFACNQPAKAAPVSPVKLHSEPVMIAGSDTKYSRDPRRLYDSEDIEDSWTNQPIDHSRLLRVDDVLKKERDIRKLSEEAEREAKQENGEDDDDDEDEENDGDDTMCVDDDDDDEDQDDNDDDDDGEDDDDDDDDDGEDDDDEDDEDYDGMSGNETDTEEGFADDDSDDDLLFFGPHPPYALSKPHKPLCCRTTSDTSLDTPHPSRRQARAPTPELPDSTDFVCGTLDEDRALEEAFVSCIESRKQKSKGAPTPQDIDPSFPVSDPESDDDDDRRVRKTRAPVSRSQSSVERRGRHGSPAPRLSRRGTVCHSPPPPRRNHSPAPSRRLHSPPPPRRPSPAPPRRLHSPPPPTRSNKSSRHPSPAPRGRAPSPARQRTIQFNTMRPLVRTRSLPRTSACVRRTAKMARAHISTSPQKRATRPVQIKRGAADIFSGLEKRRERRKAARLGTGKKDCKAGEGAEKMRELALEMGRGRKKVQCIISA